MWSSDVRRHAVGWAVLLGVLTGLAIMAASHPVVGALVIGTSFVVAAIYRASVPERDAGFLAVRGRNYDVVTLSGLGLAIIFLALSLRHTYVS